jgi:hypothetical protein
MKVAESAPPNTKSPRVDVRVHAGEAIVGEGGHPKEEWHEKVELHGGASCSCMILL